jgi:uncharacterized short protein YbdD (DUF466 family)
MFKRVINFIKQTAALMIGIPNYSAYVKHHQSCHPDKPIMSYQEFFRERQRSRYASNKQGRCC